MSKIYQSIILKIITINLTNKISRRIKKLFQILQNEGEEKEKILIKTTLLQTILLETKIPVILIHLNMQVVIKMILQTKLIQN
jgi:hypothetical protein